MTAAPPFTFTYYGVITPKERPRLGKYGNFYTPRGTHDSEEDLKACIYLALGPERPDITGRFAVKMEFVGQRGDADNLEKTVLDAGQGILWENDEQVDKVEKEKMPGQISWVKVTVKRLPSASVAMPRGKGSLR